MELTSRPIHGNGGSVTWLYDAAEKLHSVLVQANDGSAVASLTTPDSGKAADWYHHPFAHPQVPDVFSHYRKEQQS